MSDYSTGGDITYVYDKAAMARSVARMLLEIDAVLFRADEPFKLTSGMVSPVYIDCRKIISFPRMRAAMMDYGTTVILNDIGYESLDALAGGETAGIPFAAWLAERTHLTMQYVRKKPKGFGRNSQIEGNARENSEVLLVEDLATDGGSKIMFVDALRNSGLVVNDIFVVFFYDAFPGAQESMAKAGVNLHFLANWWDVLDQAEKGSYFSDSDLVSVREFLKDPTEWSKENGGK